MTKLVVLAISVRFLLNPIFKLCFSRQNQVKRSKKLMIIRIELISQRMSVVLVLLARKILVAVSLTSSCVMSPLCA